MATVRRELKRVVERYQDGLNGSDFSTIRPLFAPNVVAEWNEKATVIGVQTRLCRPQEIRSRSLP